MRTHASLLGVQAAIKMLDELSHYRASQGEEEEGLQFSSARVLETAASMVGCEGGGWVSSSVETAVNLGHYLQR